MNITSTDKAPAAVGTYSQGVELNGIFYFSGQIGLNPQSMEISENFDEQLEQILSNVDGLLSSQNLTRKNIFKTTIFMTSLSDFGKVNSAYESFFEQPYPARSCVEISALPKGALIEIEVLATK